MVPIIRNTAIILVDYSSHKETFQECCYRIGSHFLVTINLMLVQCITKNQQQLIYPLLIY